MKYFYDTEFIEDGKTIDLISIGIVAEDGREYYAVNADMPARKIRKHAWLMDNVVPHLPHGSGDERNHIPRSWLVNYGDPRVKPKSLIGDEVRDFLLADGKPELWADWAAYDHVALCQLFGTMMDLPEGVPMWTHDFRQELERAGSAELPKQESGEHNALADAKHLKRCYEYITGSRS